VCTDRTHMLAVKPGAHWETDSFGISVPVLTESEVFRPEAIDLILCPCSAFDDEGRRLGMGRGYYDRFLPQCTRAYKILVAFEAQQLHEVFTDEHDIPMDAVITESRTQFLR
ncbi:MAG: 5-formyltetrahydrofolate cyclo-ligase, partial [Oscillospiraceae bacterium]|nr:5-formyltetrahydrofolate cyclo-ligase [Oscillospiraceae bacterium]